MPHDSSRVSSRRSKRSLKTPELVADSGTRAPIDHDRRTVRAQWLGRVPYGAALDVQSGLVTRRRADECADTLLLLEHPHVITLGTSAHRENILIDEQQSTLLGIDIFDTGRGGDVTYHGPGQLVGYPILDLKPDRCDLHRYVRDLEETLIRALASLSVVADRKPGLTGVWVNDEKIAAIGVRVSSGWITSHGFALNVATNLQFFDSIVPCGITSYGVTSLERVLGEQPRVRDVAKQVLLSFCDVFERTCPEGIVDAAVGE
jgi:lipoyl(octanoyl) transferase